MYEGLSGSAYQGILTQYFDSSGWISLSSTVDSFTDTRATAPTGVNAASIEAEVKYAEEHTEPSHINAQYTIITAPGSTYESGFGNGFCAYHDVASNGAIFQFVPYIGDEPFKDGNNCKSYGSGNVANATSVTGSHEYAESITDPLWDTAPGWRGLEGAAGEISDLCATAGDKLSNGSYVQGQYDDHQNACSLADENPPHILALTDGPTNLTASSVTLNATINPEGLSTTYFFEYGTTKSYGSVVPASEVSVGSGKANLAVSQSISGLTLETAEHYRVVAKNASGITYGEDRTAIPSKWKIRTLPNGAKWGWLSGVSCPTEAACMSVGTYYDPSISPEPNQMLAYQYANGSWVQTAVPLLAGESFPELAEVSCVTTSECIAVGHVTVSGHRLPLAAKWNGTSWARLSISLPGGSENAELRGVSCAAVGDCVAVGSREIAGKVWLNYSAHLSGETWFTLETPTNESASVSVIEDVSCVATSVCLGVGWYNPTSGGGSNPVRLLMDAKGWSLQANTTGTGSLSGVTCKSLQFCMAVGRDYSLSAATSETWNGSGWSVQVKASLAGITGDSLEGVACTSPSNCAAVGFGFSSVNEATVPGAAIWNGTAWTEQTTPRESEVAQNFLSDVACAGPARCFTVGTSKASGEPRALLEARENTVVPTVDRQFGSFGTGNGQFSLPVGLAVDAEGNIWVADRVNNRITEFNAKGEYLTKFGAAGSGNGQLNGPTSLAFTSNGNLWVTDAGNHRVQQFKPNGEYLGQFGTEGTGPGKFVEPWGIAVDPTGNIWVSDSFYRVEEFSSSGAFIREQHGAGYGGSGNGEFSSPRGVATDSAGNVWVADSGNNRVQELSPAGGFIRKFGTPGSSDGQMSSPYGVAVRPSGDVLVAEKGNNRVQEFTPEGEFLAGFGSKGTAKNQFWDPWGGIAVGPGNTIDVSDGGGRHISKWKQPWSPEAITQAATNVKQAEATLNGTVNASGASTTYYFEYGPTTAYGVQAPIGGGSAGSEVDRLAVSRTVSGLASGMSYHFRLVASNNEGLTYGKDMTFKTSAPAFQGSFGSWGPGNGQFDHSAGIAQDAAGNLWVVDQNNLRVQKFNEKGEFLAKFGSEGSGDGQFGSPTDIAIDAKGNLWVTDAGYSRVEEFNASGEFLAKFGSAGSGNGQFGIGGPEAIAIDAKGNIWVGDTYNGRLQKFNEKGEFLKVVSSHGPAAGQLGEPTGIDIGLGGNVWVADWAYNRVVGFNEAGEYVRQFGSEGIGNGQFKRPDAIDVDPQGEVWVVDQNNNRVQGFSEKGEYLTQFGTSGTGAGQFSLGFPTGIATDAKGSIWVSDSNNNRVQRWGP